MVSGKLRRAGLSLLLLVVAAVVATAQEVTVTVTPVQRILPPQVMLYIDNPGRYFNVQLINNSQLTQNVYLAMTVEQVHPASGLSVRVPARRQPQTPFTVAPGQVRQLTMVELKNMFNHVVKSEVSTTPGLFDDYQNGRFGLLPEGEYEAQLTAYRWDPLLASPVAVSNPMTGKCQFTVCYKAQAPEFILPMATGATTDAASVARQSAQRLWSRQPLTGLNVARLSRQNPQFTWRAPVLACNAAAQRYVYDIKVVEWKAGQQPDDAMDRNPAIYRQNNLLTPVAIVPRVSLARMTGDGLYLAQVTARQQGTTTTRLNYTLIENEGKSTYRVFRVVDTDVEAAGGTKPGPPVVPVVPTTPKGGETVQTLTGDGGEAGGEKIPADGEKIPAGGEKILAGDDSGTPTAENTQSTASGEGYSDESGTTVSGSSDRYRFKKPQLRYPTFEEGMARKSFVGDDVVVEWLHPKFAGGTGERQDTLLFKYDVEVYRSGGKTDFDQLFKSGTPLYKKTIQDAYATTIEWEQLAAKDARPGDHLVLRVNPVCLNDKAVKYVDGNENVTDFAIAEHLAKSYFQCSDKVTITNTTPTTATEAELKGRTVGIGQYQLTIDDIKLVSGKDFYQGRGHVEWHPLGLKTMVAVKFDTLRINTDNIVFGGRAVTYQAEAEKAASNSEVVDKLFSDWGIDNLIGDTAIPYASELQQQATDEVKNLAEKLDVAKYYEYVKKGNAVLDQFLEGEVSDLHLPVSLPKSVNKSPVDIQIVSLKFTPTSATMDVLGEFALPDSKYYAGEVLLLGAPRLCIGPDQLLPESGTLALLANFTLTDPQSSFDMTFKAPTNVLEPSDGCFVSWHDNKFELFDVDVDMTIPSLVKVDAEGNRTEEHPVLNFHASIGSWDDWFAEASMDNFEVADLKDWTFAPGDRIVYDHSRFRNADGMALPVGFDKVKAGLEATDLDAAWQGLYVKRMGIVFPKMLSISDGDKNFNGRLKLDGEEMFFDASGCSMQFGANNVFDFNTAKVGGWGISMKELKLDVLQNAFQKTYFSGEIKTPLKGQIGYRCDIYAQGKDAQGLTDPGRTAYVFKTQQVKGLEFDFWLGKMDFDHDQTYFLVEAEKETGKEVTTKVELCMGGDMTITVASAALKKLGKVGTFVNASLPGISVNGMRIANCERWKSHYTQNQYEAPKSGGGLSMNDFFGWKDEYNIQTDKFYFSLGRWSLSLAKGGSATAQVQGVGESEAGRWLMAQGGHGPSAPHVQEAHAVTAGEAVAKGSLACFDFSLNDFNFKYSGGQAVLTVGGSIGLMDGLLSAGCGLDLVADVDLSNYDLSFNTVRFKEASFSSGFGGMKLEGSLTAADGDDDGYSGKLTFTMPGDFFGFEAEGGYFRRDTGTEKFVWGYFKALATSSTGIRLDPIVINSIRGGFYFNCKAPADYTAKPTSKDASQGVYGGMLGMGFSTTAGENMLSADMDLTVVYDAKRKRLSSLIFNGKMNAIKGSQNSNGLVNATAQLAYVQETDTRKYLQINITASGGATLDNEMTKLLKDFSGKAQSAGKAVESGLQDITTGDTKSGSSNEADKSKKQNTFGASCGFKVSLDFKLTMEDGKKTRWHLYIGEPPYAKRCSLTLIDFQAGKKSDSFAAWAYLGCNMYLCLGNELPDAGAMPDPPKRVMDFLNGTDVNGNKQSQGNDAKNLKTTARQSMMSMLNQPNVAGGLMVGAGAEGDFGVNAGIVYAHAYFAFGFDLVLKKFEDGAKCQGGRSMGYNGFYGMGQAYAMMQGDIGVRIRLWFVKKDVPLVEAGLGALLQAGLPNPTWVYGKARARCSLLGGLFKFNHSIEFKAGEVCMPDYGDPLDNIEIIASGQPGSENEKEGFSTEVSPYVAPRFTTNFEMNREVRLVDENAAQKAVSDKGYTEEQARSYTERSYRFVITGCSFHRKDNDAAVAGTSYSSDDAVNYNVKHAPFAENTEYYMKVTAKAEEYDPKAGAWANPMIEGKRQSKVETKKYYFKTGKKSADVRDNIVWGLPASGTWNAVRLEDMKRPYLCLNDDRSDLVGAGQAGSAAYNYKWVLSQGSKVLEEKPNYVRRSVYGVNRVTGQPSLKAETWEPASAFTKVKQGGTNYKVSLVRYNKGAGTNTKARQVFTHQNNKKQTTTRKSTKSATNLATGSYASQPSAKATENYAQQMNNFFAQEEKTYTKNENVIDQGNREYTDDVKLGAGEEEIFSFKAKTVDGGSFASDAMARPYETAYMAMKDLKIDDMYATSWNDFSHTYPGDETVLDERAFMRNMYLTQYFYSHYVFLGGKEFKGYAYSDIKRNTEGLKIKLTAPHFRSGSSTPYDFFDGMLQDVNNHYLTTMLRVPFIPPSGYSPVWYRSAAWETSWERYKVGWENQPLEQTSLHLDMLSALCSDAYGTQWMTEVINEKAKSVSTSIANIYADEKKKDSKHKKRVTYYVDNTVANAKISMKNTGSHRIDVKIPSGTQCTYFKPFTFSVPVYQFFQLANMSGLEIKKFSKVEDVTNFRNWGKPHYFSHRYTNASNVWSWMKNWHFDAAAQLRRVKKMEYYIWRNDVYLWDKSRPAIMRDKTGNMKSRAVNNPFQDGKTNVVL